MGTDLEHLALAGPASGSHALPVGEALALGGPLARTLLTGDR